MPDTQCYSVANKDAARHFESVAGYWKEVYEQQDVESVIYQYRRAMVLSSVGSLPLPQRAEVLEVGCGAGLTAIALARLGHAVKAVDVSISMLAIARQLATEAKLEHRMNIACGDVHTMPFHRSCFDLVLAIGVLPWVSSIDRAVREMVRVLRPDGYLIVSSDNRYRATYLAHPLALVRLLRKETATRLCFSDAHTEPTAKMYSTTAFDAQLSTLGLEKVSGKTLGFGPFWGLSKVLGRASAVRLHRALQRLADQGCPILRSTGSHYISAWKNVSARGTPIAAELKPE